ncbi:XRE family transcriptional regulator [Ammonifex thiophilus]|uniref:XRE family transcriptional regulator n=1 Tax=Ammonifex thiophilus TaxID=444093 RepID=A0A3D8P3E4_9THEO|nr:XRE family transcriptional regulator [Ammonifex thiophilus]
MLKERLKNLRKQKGLLQKEVAASIGVPRSTYASWESPANKSLPETEHLVKLADFFGVSIDYLLGKTDDPSPKGTDVGDIETYLQKILSGEIPIQFCLRGVDRITPEVLEDIKNALRVVLAHIRDKRRLLELEGGASEEAGEAGKWAARGEEVKVWILKHQMAKGADLPCSPSGSGTPCGKSSPRGGCCTPATSLPVSASPSSACP